jgi:hypothetical protein
VLRRVRESVSLPLAAPKNGEHGLFDTTYSRMIRHDVAGSKHAIAEANVLANDGNRISERIPGQMGELTAAGNEYVVAGPARVLVDPPCGPVYPSSAGLQLGRERSDPLCLRLPAVIPFCIFVEASGLACRFSDDEPVLVAIRRRAPVKREALVPTVQAGDCHKDEGYRMAISAALFPALDGACWQGPFERDCPMEGHLSLGCAGVPHSVHEPGFVHYAARMPAEHR